MAARLRPVLGVLSGSPSRRAVFPIVLYVRKALALLPRSRYTPRSLEPFSLGRFNTHRAVPAAMPIDLSPFNQPPLCFGFQWLIKNQDDLAACVAYLVAGYYLHAEKIIHGDRPEVALQASAVQAAIQRLENVDVYQRDGWLFQMISWIAARLASGNETLAAPPHIRTADKGFDGLLLEVDEETDVVKAVVICEDKATKNPRETLRDDVWPEIRHIESGARDNELVSEVTTILGTYSHSAIEKAIEQIYWNEQRQYRVSITAGPAHSDSEGRAKLFEGYDQVATGDLARRRSETVQIPDLRDWLERLCASVINKLRGMKAP